MGRSYPEVGGYRENSTMRRRMIDVDTLVYHQTVLLMVVDMVV